MRAMESNFRGFMSASGILKENSSSRPLTRSVKVKESSSPLSNSESSSPISIGFVETVLRTFNKRSRMPTLSRVLWGGHFWRQPPFETALADPESPLKQAAARNGRPTYEENLGEF